VSVAVFELGGALAPALPELAVGPWKMAPPGLVAFEAGRGHPESVWRVDLARDDAASRAAFADGERSVARAHAALDDVPRRLDRALGRARAALAQRPGPARHDRGTTGGPGSGSMPLALPHVPAVPAESDLIAALAGAELDLPPPADLLMAWSAGSAGASAPQAWLERALDRVADLARGRARIETQVEGALVAHSVMALSGDTELWAAPRLSPASARLHARSVAVAVRTRHAWARILALVVSSGGRIVALGLPGAGVSALPMVWRFVRGVLREVSDRTASPRPAA
jgi:hypothetical protein